MRVEEEFLRRGLWWLRDRDGSFLRWSEEEASWQRVADRPPPPLPASTVFELGDPSVQDWSAADVEMLKIAGEHFRHDLSIFWTHSNFFLLIQGALLSVYITQTASNPDSFLIWTLGMFGVLLAAFWYWVQHARVALIQRWREQVKRLDMAVDRHQVYVAVESYVQGHKLRSPTYFSQFLPLLFVLGWALLITARLIG